MAHYKAIINKDFSIKVIAESFAEVERNLELLNRVTPLGHIIFN